jgi:hypothetical protein
MFSLAGANRGRGEFCLRGCWAMVASQVVILAMSWFDSKYPLWEMRVASSEEVIQAPI